MPRDLILDYYTVKKCHDSNFVISSGTKGFHYNIQNWTEGVETAKAMYQIVGQKMLKGHVLINYLWPSDTMIFSVSTGSGIGFLPDSTKPLPQPMLTYNQWDPLAFIPGQCLLGYPRYQSPKLFETDMKWHPHLPEDNELMLHTAPWLLK